MSSLRNRIKTTPLVGPIAIRLRRGLAALAPSPVFGGSAEYWDKRYVGGGNSGAGSYDEFAAFKANFLNVFVAENGIESVIEYGCGDGNQLTLAEYPRYLGFDVSERAIEMCRGRFHHRPDMAFRSMDEWDGDSAHCTLSLDVIYHLVEDDVFDDYMARLFDTSERFVVVYSSDTADGASLGHSPALSPHVRHRRFSDWVSEQRPNWKLARIQRNPHAYDVRTGAGSFADFYVFERDSALRKSAPDSET